MDSPDAPADRAMLRASDFEAVAAQALAGPTWEYLAAGAGAERTPRTNREAFERHALMPRVLTGVHDPDPSTCVLGQDLSLPVLAAPTAFHGLADPDGEVGTASAMADAGSVTVLSDLTSCSVSEVGKAAPGRLWQQLFIYRDRSVGDRMVAQAEEAGCSALVLCVDAPVLGLRPREKRSGFLPPIAAALERMGASAPAGHSLFDHVADLHDPAAGWKDVERLRERTQLPLVLKGILHPDDAVRAVEAGADGVIVSNHGGRQLDGAVAALDALPAVAERLDRSCPVLVDGGLRSGVDVLVALALGADAVLAGRPVVHALAAQGREGVLRLMGILRDELVNAMALVGRTRVSDLDKSLLRHGFAQSKDG